MSVFIRTGPAALTFVFTSVLWAGIPEPDVRLHGRLALAGQPVLAGSNVSLVAELADTQSEIGRFLFNDIDLNDCNRNGRPDERDIANGAPDMDGDGIIDECNRYVLRLRMEASVSGETDNPLAARIGDRVFLYALNEDQNICVGGVDPGADCLLDSDCPGDGTTDAGVCAPAKTMMARFAVTETGVIRELNLGTCRDGSVSNLAVASSRLHVKTASSGSADGSSWADALGGL